MNLARVMRLALSFLTGDAHAADIVLAELDDPHCLRQVTILATLWIAARITRDTGGVDEAIRHIETEIAIALGAA